MIGLSTYLSKTNFLEIYSFSTGSMCSSQRLYECKAMFYWYLGAWMYLCSYLALQQTRRVAWVHTKIKPSTKYVSLDYFANTITWRTFTWLPNGAKMSKFAPLDITILGSKDEMLEWNSNKTTKQIASDFLALVTKPLFTFRNHFNNKSKCGCVYCIKD